MGIGLNKRLRSLKHKIKWAMSSEAAFKAVTGKDSLEEIMWAYETLSPTDREHANWLAGKLKLDKHKGKYFTAWFYVQGKARKDIGKKYASEVKTLTKRIAKKIKIEGDESG